MLRYYYHTCFSLATSTDDRSTLSDDDEGISSDDLDDEDISRKAIHRALRVLIFAFIVDICFLIIYISSILFHSYSFEKNLSLIGAFNTYFC